MAPPASPTVGTDANTWAVDRATSLPKGWVLVAAFSGLVEAWRLLGVCCASVYTIRTRMLRGDGCPRRPRCDGPTQVIGATKASVPPRVWRCFRIGQVRL